MAVDVSHIVDVIEVMENFMSRKRPPEEMRDELDLGYKIEDQSVIIHEIRTSFPNPKMKFEPLIAKATYVKKSGSWKVFWMRADLKWHSYKPKPVVDSLSEFVELVDEDAYHLFFG
ncbi:MAG: DUF3024 domain-containing protein [Sphingobacteriales bacterium]|nr:MAG: DUF3024 domain-containing protein [Sphingobacteriales bacterium]